MLNTEGIDGYDVVYYYNVDYDMIYINIDIPVQVHLLMIIWWYMITISSPDIDDIYILGSRMEDYYDIK